MNIFILQKSITDLKSPINRKQYSTCANTLGEFICEMVEKNSTAKEEPSNRIELFDTLISRGSDRIAYGSKKIQYGVEDMQKFAIQACEDKLYLVKNVTKGILYESVAQDMQLSEDDEIALIKLKYVRGALW